MPQNAQKAINPNIICLHIRILMRLIDFIHKYYRILMNKIYPFDYYLAINSFRNQSLDPGSFLPYSTDFTRILDYNSIRFLFMNVWTWNRHDYLFPKTRIEGFLRMIYFRSEENIRHFIFMCFNLSLKEATSEDR